jgi:GNAT superfamily N-acetyltransferase
MPVEIRPAEAADAPFLAEMLVAAAFWRPEGPQGKVSDVMDQPELAHYVVGWPQPGDCGVIAEDEHPVGAAWFRFLPASDPGFGFVDAKTPEVGMGVALSRRRQGIGSRLLSSLVAQARSDGLATLSLSVARDNYAEACMSGSASGLSGQLAGRSPCFCGCRGHPTSAGQDDELLEPHSDLHMGILHRRCPPCHQHRWIEV